MKRGSATSGVVLAELTLILGISFLFVLTIVDIGLLVRTSNALIASAQSGARNGAALATPHQTVWCDPGLGIVTGSFTCREVASWDPSFRPFAPEPSLIAFESAMRVSCEYLGNSGISIDDWSVRVTTPSSLYTEGAAPAEAKLRSLIVRLEPSDPIARRCLFCVNPLVQSLVLGATSRYAMQVNC